MEQSAKYLLKKITEKVALLTDKKISQISYAPKENEWRAYICKSKPHWEDIAWRVKEPNENGEAEFHIGFFSAIPNVELNLAIKKVEELTKEMNRKLIINENGVRLIWMINLKEQTAINKLLVLIYEILPAFLNIAFENLFQFNKQDSVKKSVENITLTIEKRVIQVAEDEKTEISKQAIKSSNETLKESIDLLYNQILNNTQEASKEILFWRHLADETLGMPPEQLCGIIGDFDSLNNNLIQYKIKLEELASFDNEHAKKLFYILDNYLDEINSENILSIKKAEKNRGDKRKVSSNLKNLKSKVSDFEKIFANYSYNGWVP